MASDSPTERPATPAASAEVALERAGQLIRMGEVVSAREALAALLATWPDHADSRNMLGWLLTRRAEDGSETPSDLRLGIEHLRCALALEPTHRDANHNLADALFRAGEIDEAMQWYERSTDILRGDAPLSWFGLAQCAELMGDLREAARYLDLALRYEGNADRKLILQQGVSRLRATLKRDEPEPISRASMVGHEHEGARSRPIRLPPDRAVDCDCDAQFHLPIARDHTGVVDRLSGCLCCGTISFARSLVEEPRPHDVRCVGRDVLPLASHLSEWASMWPRWSCAGDGPRDPVLLPSAAQCAGVEELSALEAREKQAQATMPLNGRFLRSGIPHEPPPDSLPGPLGYLEHLWEVLHLADDISLNTLLDAFHPPHSVARVRPVMTPAVLLLLERAERQPAHLGQLLERLTAGNTMRRRQALFVLGLLEDPPGDAVDAFAQRLRAPELSRREIGLMLTVIRRLGARAVSLRPALEALAEVWAPVDYYFGKSIRRTVRQLDE